MTITAGNIQIAGPLTLYIGTESTIYPANTVAKGSAWTAPWVDSGATVGGAQWQPDTEHFEVVVDQYNAPVKDVITAQRGTLKFAMAEKTTTNLKQALGYGTVTTGSTETKLGVTPTDFFPTYYAVGIEVFGTGASGAATTRYERFWIPKGLFKISSEIQYTKDGVAALEVEVRATLDTTQTSTEQLYAHIVRTVA